MRILKMVIRLLALISLAAFVITGKVVSAVFLLVFSSMSLGIMVGEKQMEESYEKRNRKRIG